MNKKLRYCLIAAGVAGFLVLAPLIVFFVSGIKYDFQQKKFVPTGILAIKSEPQDLEIYLDGKLVKTSSGEIRFLEPKDYQVMLKKPGFYPWAKLVTIEANKVAWIKPPNNKLHLLAQDKSPRTLASGVADFFAWPNGLLVLSGNELLFADDWDLAQAKKMPLPNGLRTIAASPDFRWFLLTAPAENQKTPGQTLVFDLPAQKLYDLSLLLTNAGEPPALEFSQNGRLLALENLAVYEIKLADLTQQLLVPKVASFKIAGRTLYYLTADETSRTLMSLNLETREKQALLSNLPRFQQAKILINAQKRIFIIADGALYTASSNGLSKLGENLRGWQLEQPEQTLAFLPGDEFWYADEQGNAFFITRVSATLKLPAIKKSLGYAFAVKNNSLLALDFDQRAQQNAYELYPGNNIQKYLLDDKHEKILILDSGELKEIKIQ